MTYREFFKNRLGEKKFKKLTPQWLRHIQRIDSLPKPKRDLSPEQILELVSA